MANSTPLSSVCASLEGILCAVLGAIALLSAVPGPAVGDPEVTRYGLSRDVMLPIRLEEASRRVQLVAPSGTRATLDPAARDGELVLNVSRTGTGTSGPLPLDVRAGCTGPESLDLTIERLGAGDSRHLGTALIDWLEANYPAIAYRLPADDRDPALLVDVEMEDYACQSCEARPVEDCLVGTWELDREDMARWVGIGGAYCGTPTGGSESWEGSFRLEIGPEGRLTTHYDGVRGRAADADTTVETVLDGMASSCVETDSFLGRPIMNTGPFEWRVEQRVTQACGSYAETRVHIDSSDSEKPIAPAITIMLLSNPRYICSETRLDIKGLLRFDRIDGAEGDPSPGVTTVGEVNLRVETEGHSLEQGVAPIEEPGAQAIERAMRRLEPILENLSVRIEETLHERYPGRDVFVSANNEINEEVDQTGVVQESQSIGGDRELIITYYEYSARVSADIDISYRVGRLGSP